MACDWWDLPGAAPQFATRRNLDRPTFGPQVTKIMLKLGFDPMPWQRYVLDVQHEYEEVPNPSGKGLVPRMVYRDNVEIVPRQAGKTAKTLGQQIHRATTVARRLKRPQRMIYTAQRHIDARQKLLEDHWPIVEASPYARFAELGRSTGQEGIAWSNGSQQHIAAPTRKAGHGGSIDLAHIDEAFALEDDDVEQGIKPTQITRREAQFYIQSAAGNHRSTYLRGKLELGRETVRHGIDSGTSYFEWGADGLDVDQDDPATWAAHHPAVGFTIDTRDLAADHLTMKPQEFARAYLAIWPTRRKPRVIPATLWDKLADPKSRCLDPVRFAIDIAPDRSMAAIAAAGRRHDGRLHIEVIDHREGTAWLVSRVDELLHRHPKSSISVDTIGPAATLLPELQRRRIPVRLLTTPDVARSMGFLIDQVKAERLVHRDQVELNVALGAADKRRIGDKWAWARADGDITPIVAVTFALWSLETAPESKKWKMGIAV